MATGFGNAGQCFASSQEAIDAHFSGLPVVAAANDTTHYLHVVSHVKTGGVWLRQHDLTNQASTGIIASYTATRSVPTFTPYSCSLAPQMDPVENFTDGNILGWLVVAAMAAAWGLMVLKRSLS